MKNYDFGVVRPMTTEEQYICNYIANKHENTLPMLNHPYFKLNWNDTHIVAAVAMRGLSLNGWTCQQTYQWWCDYRRRYAEQYHSSSPTPLCGPKIFQRIWNAVAEQLPFHQERMQREQWFYMNVIDWTGKLRRWYFTKWSVKDAIAYYNMHRRQDNINQEYRALFSVTWDGKQFTNPRRIALSKLAA